MDDWEREFDVEITEEDLKVMAKMSSADKVLTQDSQGVSFQ